MRITFILMVLFTSITQIHADDFKDGQLAYDSGDYIKAQNFFTKACDSGNALGCSEVATMYYNGEGIDRDYSKAKKFYGKACDNGDIRGCRNSAILTLAVN